MRQITIELDDEEMEQLVSAARARHIDPERMSKVQLLKLLTHGKRPKWRPGLSARRNKIALKTAQTGPDFAAHAIPDSQSNPTFGTNKSHSITGASVEERRAQRLALLKSMEGIWKDDPDKPQDGVAYQKELRSEWG